MTLQKFINSRKSLFWSIRNLNKLSQASVVENTLNYGDFNDVKQLLKLMGIKKVARIFRQQIKQKRHNYRPEIKHFFSLYFRKHAS